MLCVFQARSDLPNSASISSGSGSENGFSQVFLLGWFQEIFIYKFLSFRGKLQEGNPEFESSHNDSSVSSIILPDQFCIILKSYVKLKLHRRKDLVFQLFEERVPV